MTVIIVQDSPDAIRGVLKRWFVEPKPNVFVGSVNRGVREHVLKYIKEQAGGIRMLIIYSANNSQGYTIEQFNDPDYFQVNLSGLSFVATPQSDIIEPF